MSQTKKMRANGRKKLLLVNEAAGAQLIFIEGSLKMEQRRLGETMEVGVVLLTTLCGGDFVKL